VDCTEQNALWVNGMHKKPGWSFHLCVSLRDDATLDYVPKPMNYQLGHVERLRGNSPNVVCGLQISI
jgi:hypothetical protein